VLPLVAVGVTWRWMYSDGGVINQVLGAVGLDGLSRAWLGDFNLALPAIGLIGAWTLTGFCMMLFLSGVQKIDTSLYEAAQLDGAGRLTIFFKIVLPLVGPGLTAAAILTFLGAWGQYLVPLIFSPNVTKPLTVLIPEFATKNFIDYGLITAAGSIAIVIPALVVIFLNRYLVSGLLAGSVK
jgi:multiple sugar transport system permease protein